MIDTSDRPGSTTITPLVAVVRRWSTVSAPLTLFAAGMTLLTLLFVVGVLADGRTIGGQAAWLKPTKFGLSLAIYSFTILWMLGFVASDRPWVRRIVAVASWTIVVGFAIEIALIVLQVVRGTTSHFNVATPFDAAVWSGMAIAVVALWAANLALAVVLMVQRFERPSFAWSLRLGLVVAVIGMGQGFLMTSPTAQQLAGWQAGEPVTIVGAHTVGAPDGGAGLPVTGWRTDAGDLRVGHFVGIHALQAIPLVGVFLMRRRRLSEGQRTALVVTAAVGYLGLTVLLTIQALLGQPLLQPDATIALALAALVLAVVIVSAAILRPTFADRHRGVA